MRKFDFIVRDENGIHARPAALLVKKCSQYSSIIMVEANGKIAKAKNLLAVMTLCIKKNDCITVTIEGEDEDLAIESLKSFAEECL